MTRNVVILGCGRSGTSIFGELFEALPGFTYLSEPTIPEIAAAVDRPLAVKVPTALPGDSPAPGCPVDLDELFAVLPSPVVFWQVRHPLDAICSLRVGIDQNWGHHPRPPDWEEWLDRPLLERCAHHWAVINGAGYDAVAERAIVSRFEDLIGDAAGAASAAARSVGLDPDDAAVGAAVAAWAQRVQDTDNEHFVEAMTSRRHSRPDHVHRVERWRENLTDADVEMVAPIVAKSAATFGYELPAQPSAAGSGKDGTSTPGT